MRNQVGFGSLLEGPVNLADDGHFGGVVDDRNLAVVETAAMHFACP